MAQNSKRKIAGTPVLLEAKARQASKLAEIREALVVAGFDTTAKQAAAFGLCREHCLGRCSIGTNARDLHQW